MPLEIAIDRGGTFTDVYATTGEQEIVLKLLSVDPANYDDAPTEGIRRVLEQVTGVPIPKSTKIDASGISQIRMGTTVATNGLLERKGDRTVFVTTKGFRDILAIGQQARPDIFDLEVSKLDQLYDTVVEIDERVTLEQFSENPVPAAVNWSDPDIVRGISGEAVRILQRPNVEQIRSVLQQVWDSGVRSLAIALLHGYTFVDHEKLVAQVAREVGFTSVSVSNELQPMIKLVSRAASATANAYLSPLITRYVRQIGDGFAGGIEAISPKLLFMQSDGGLAPVNHFTGLRAILSGPAGGVVGYARTSYEPGGTPVLGFDMGGTSTDVSRFSGHLEHVFETTTAQVTIQAPQLDIQTVAAGGGSILSFRSGLFCVGPESASAHPGPACYRKGGPLTVTDANLFLGRIDVQSFPHIFGPGENEPLDEEIVRTKFEALTAEINALNASEGTTALTPHQVALGFLSVANETMCRPIRSLTEGKGYATAGHTLASFGGAGGQHACAVAHTLGISRVVIHRFSSILSAYGIALADIVADVQQPENCALEPKELPRLQERLDALEKDAVAQLRSQVGQHAVVEVERYLNVRYKGSETFLMIKENDESSVEESFVAMHRREFGFVMQRELLVGDVRVRVAARTPVDEQKLLPPSELDQIQESVTPLRTHRVFFEQGWVDAGIFDLSKLPDGAQIPGPALILDTTQTLVVAPGCKAQICPYHVVLNVALDAPPGDHTDAIDPVQLSVFGHRFMSIAEQMGQTLQKTAISTNIKERLDFSCAVFAPDGGLVANAPHIPVHLGSMSSAVAYQKKLWEGKLQDGDVLVANHPAFGGSHLPDLTVITPVFEDGRLVFWVASRGHHSDIGGITAGSMPPFSKFLWEEGARIKGHKVVSAGTFDADGFHRLLVEEPAKFPRCSGSRSYSDSLSDLKAQIAANTRGIALIRALAAETTLPVVQKYMVAIQRTAELSVRNLLLSVAKSHGPHLEAKDYLDDGSTIALSVDIDTSTGGAKFDFTGTSSQMLGNLNAPRAITYSAILYCLRTMISDDIPLNQGCLAPLDIDIPEGSLLAPGPDAACVGGNVETSQRVTDVVYRAFKAVSGSQGTCNNLTFGFGDENTPGFGYYETIAGGAGAGPTWSGQSGVQVHMTNTRATDPEVFEKRYPVLLHQFSIREGSGGSGKYQGGNGVIREIEFRHPIQVSILSERRAHAPYGLLGGEDGARGRNLWITKDGRALSLGGKNTVQLEIGDRIVIETPGGGGYGIKDTSTEA